MRVLLFAGAGTSVELGVPAMTGLAQEFQEHCRQHKVHTELVDRILAVKGLDIEHLIETLDLLSGAGPALDLVGEHVNGVEAAGKARAEVEWFVQHSAERVRSHDARFLWTPVIRSSCAHQLTVATTNYDRAVEMAARGIGARLCDGFGDFEDLEFARWEGVANGQSGKVDLLKLHGSTDWYALDGSGDPIKLRHPVALYGRSELRLPSGPRLKSALILPSQEKRLNERPYPRVSQAFLNVVDLCELAIFVGSSLRDGHIKDAAQTVASRVPTFIVNTDPSSVVANAKLIHQHASTFLISTLPNALAGDTMKTLDAAAQDTSKQTGGILSAVRTLSDSEDLVVAKQEAIERVEATGGTLDFHLLRELIADNDAGVARYALSLVHKSEKALELLSVAENSPHTSDDAYRTDLSLLKKML